MTFRIDQRVIGVGPWSGYAGIILSPKGGPQIGVVEVMWIGQGVCWVDEREVTHDPHAGERCSCGVVGSRYTDTEVHCGNEACEVIAFRRSA